LWGDRIVQLLADRPQSWLVRETGISSSALSDILSRNMPNAENAVKIAKALGTSAEYLITGDGPGPGPRLVAGSAVEGAAGVLGGLRSGGATESAAAVGRRYRQAIADLETAIEAVGIVPDEALRQVLVGLLFKQAIPVEDIAILLAAKARQEETP
jgi:transcriptional regulator with XRE-family HTH domain